MKKSQFLLIIIILILVSAGILRFTGLGRISVPNNVSENLSASTTLASSSVAIAQVSPTASHSPVIISEPLAGAVVASPLTIRGQAPGSWFFEATLPIKLFAADNTLLAQAPARAQADWTTSALVPFTASLDFPPTTATSGYLVISKDNPSALPQYDASITEPLKFK